MKNKLISNFIYQGIYQITVIILPIITIPIVSHVLGVEGIGIYNFVMSIVSYFILTAGLGLATYGIREIATVKNDKKKLSQKFWELEFFNIIVVLIVIIMYSLLLFFLNSKLYFIVAGISLLATLFDISWFYYGIQDFKQITVINVIVKILSFFSIVLFVKNENDLLTYFFIQSISIVVSNITLWFFLFPKVDWVLPKLPEVTKHLKPALHFFVGKISITLYTTLNKTLLGLLGTAIFVGIYTNSLQLVTIFVTLIGTLDTVLLPYMTNLFSNDGKSQMIRLMEKTIDVQLFFTIPLMFGIVATNSSLIPWFFGNQFLYLNKTVPFFAPLVIVMPLGISIVRQYLMPQNKIRNFNISVLIAAIVSIILNLILIPIVGLWGAIIATVVSEFIVTIVRMYDLLKNTDFKFNVNNISIYTLASFIMFCVIIYFTKNSPPTIRTTVTQGIIGITIYFVLTILIKKNPIINLKKMNKKENNK